MCMTNGILKYLLGNIKYTLGKRNFSCGYYTSWSKRFEAKLTKITGNYKLTSV